MQHNAIQCNIIPCNAPYHNAMPCITLHCYYISCSSCKVDWLSPLNSHWNKYLSLIFIYIYTSWPHHHPYTLYKWPFQHWKINVYINLILDITWIHTRKYHIYHNQQFSSEDFTHIGTIFSITYTTIWMAHYTYYPQNEWICNQQTKPYCLYSD